MRRLSPGEAALAGAVFGEAIDLDRVRLTPWPAGFGMVVGSLVLLPPAMPDDFAEAGARMQAWLLHELTHVWQFQTRPWWTLRSWAGVVISGGYGPGLPGYRLPERWTWDALNLEQQARAVETGWLGGDLRGTPFSNPPPQGEGDRA
jgi:hypothetical protein